MPIPLQNHGAGGSLNANEVTRAVEQALSKSGVPVREEAIEALNNAGADISRLATEIANIIYTAKPNTKLNAIKMALGIHGLDLEPNAASGPPTINFNIQTEQANIQSLFAPHRPDAGPADFNLEDSSLKTF